MRYVFKRKWERFFFFIFRERISDVFEGCYFEDFFCFRIGRGLGVNVGFFVSFSIFFGSGYIQARRRNVKIFYFFFLSLQIPFEMKGMFEKRKKVFKEIKI